MLEWRGQQETAVVIHHHWTRLRCCPSLSDGGDWGGEEERSSRTGTERERERERRSEREENRRRRGIRGQGVVPFSGRSSPHPPVAEPQRPSGSSLSFTQRPGLACNCEC